MSWIEGKTSGARTSLSTGNSSDDILLNGSEFTGLGELNAYESVFVSIATDQNGTFYIEFSADGSNWDTSLSYKYDTSRINPPHVFEKGYRYFRVRFVNDSGSDQTFFRLVTSYGSYGKLTSPINGTVSENFDATVVRPTEYHSEVAMGKRQGRNTVNKFGYNLDVDTGAGGEIIAAWGGSFDPLTDIMQTAQTFTVSYNNSTDGSGQDGARMLQIIYIDENFTSQTAIHVLGSTGTDVTSFTGLGINRAVCISFGTDAFNTNDITITATTDATIQAVIPAENNVTQQCIYHTQINHNFLWSQYLFNSTKTVGGGGGVPEVIIKGYSFSRVTLGRYEIFRLDFDTQRGNHVDQTWQEPFVLGGREVIYFTAESDTNNTQVNFRFSGIEERIL